MNENLKQFALKNNSLTDAELTEFNSLFELHPIKRLDHLFIEGEKINKIYFIEEGVVRCYFLKNGKEYTTNFYFGTTMVTDLISIRKNIPALVNIQALKFSNCLIADFFEVEKLMIKCPNIARIFYYYMEEHYIFGLKRQMSFIFESPQERYIKLFAERPNVIAEIPQHYIASYLGIKPETLSRIKKRILQ